MCGLWKEHTCLDVGRAAHDPGVADEDIAGLKAESAPVDNKLAGSVIDKGEFHIVIDMGGDVGEPRLPDQADGAFL